MLLKEYTFWEYAWTKMIYFGGTFLVMGGALLAGLLGGGAIVCMVYYIMRMVYYIGHCLSSVIQTTSAKMYTFLVSMRVINAQNGPSDIGIGLLALMLFAVVLLIGISMIHPIVKDFRENKQAIDELRKMESNWMQTEEDASSD
jgi:uncharacterized protein (UPF0333 family)